MDRKDPLNLTRLRERLSTLLQSDLLGTWPNRLTLARIAFIPLILFLYPLDFVFTDIFCVLIFLVAAVTDFLDGYLARKHNQVTSFGTLLDPIADKMLMAAALVVLAHAKQLPPLIAGIILCRDILVSGVRMIALEQNVRIEVNQFGKIKTFVADFGIPLLLLRRDEFAGIPARAIGMLCMWAALLLALYSAYLYLLTFSEKTKFLRRSGR